ncbi:MAG: hydrolase [Fimbriimonadales bacterium]|nr:MAG: hydrolase [Fimbriimonadales bacterium]
MPVCRLLAVDIDFTLVDDERKVPLENAEALRRAREAGIEVALASGRIVSSLRLYCDEIGWPMPLIACNGAYVLDADGQVLADHRLDSGVVEAVVSECERRGFHVNVYAEDRLSFAERTPMAEKYLQRARRSYYEVLPWSELRTQRANKLIVVDEPQRLETLRGWLVEELPKDKAIVTYSEPEYLEVLCPDCSKATGLAALAKRMGIEREATAAIGDYYNDVEMLAWAGFSAAVENAVPEAKAVADCVVRSYRELGVARFVEMLLKNVGK